MSEVHQSRGRLDLARPVERPAPCFRPSPQHPHNRLGRSRQSARGGLLAGVVLPRQQGSAVRQDPAPTRTRPGGRACPRRQPHPAHRRGVPESARDCSTSSPVGRYRARAGAARPLAAFRAFLTPASYRVGSHIVGDTERCDAGVLVGPPPGAHRHRLLTPPAGSALTPSRSREIHGHRGSGSEDQTGTRDPVRSRRPGSSVLVDAVELGRSGQVPVRTAPSTCVAYTSQLGNLRWGQPAKDEPADRVHVPWRGIHHGVPPGHGESGVGGAPVLGTGNSLDQAALLRTAGCGAAGRS
jgi:hypothetical protein